MGRMKNMEPCLRRECSERGAKRGLCLKHYQEWYRKYGHLRCEWAGCRNILRGVRSSRTEGRRLSHGGGRAIAYCREHEWHHLVFTPEVHQLNRARLGQEIQPLGDCWTWAGRVTTAKQPYGKFVPEGAGNLHWMAHRISYDLLVGGHKQGLVLDHVCGNSLCVSPAHLEPVKQGENLRRRNCPMFTPILVNITPSVLRFAEEFGLPLPALDGPMALAA